MNVDWEFLNQVVENDATTRFVYENDGKNCFIGGLAIALGVSLPEAASKKTPITFLAVFASEISRLCGLSLMELVQLQEVNDAFPRVSSRRVALHSRLNQLEKGRQP